jgi:hypothetical protein
LPLFSKKPLEVAMKREFKLNPQQQVSHTAASRQTEFASPEEMLRHDALHTPVPPAIEHRLRESIGPVAPAPRSWWRRLFGK